MRNPKGLVPFFAVIIIAVIAGALVASAWWYNRQTEERDALSNLANQLVNAETISNFEECESAGYPVMESYPRQCSAKGKTYTEVIADTNTTTNTNSTATNTNAHIQTNTTANVNANIVTDMSALTPGCPTWQTYTDTEYAWTMDYPCDWTYEYIYETSGDEVLFDYPIRYTIFTDPTGEYRLLVGIKQVGDVGSTLNRTGVGAGEFVSQDPITIAGTSVPVKNLEYQNKVKEVMFYQSGAVSIGAYQLTSSFDQDQDVVAYDDIDLEGTTELEIGTTILQSLVLP